MIVRNSWGPLLLELSESFYFFVYFRNNDGYVTKSEMLNTTSKLTEEQVTAVFSRNDKDGDGKLSKEEFTEMMCKEKRQLEN